MVIFIQLDRTGQPQVFTQYKDTDVVLVDWRNDLSIPRVRTKPVISSLYARSLEDVPLAFVDPDED